MGLAAACQVYLFSIISTPKDSKASRSLKWKAPCQVCDSYSSGLFKVVCVEVWSKTSGLSSSPNSVFWTAMMCPCGPNVGRQ